VLMPSVKASRFSGWTATRRKLRRDAFPQKSEGSEAGRSEIKHRDKRVNIPAEELREFVRAEEESLLTACSDSSRDKIEARRR